MPRRPRTLSTPLPFRAGPPLGLALLLTTGLMSSVVRAQEADAPTLRPERPILPGWSMAGDDGAGSIWSNPANLALDPDPSWIALATQAADAPVDQGRTLSTAANLGPLGAGIHTTDGPDGVAWWTLSSSLGLRLDRTVALGGHLGWQLPEGPDNNFMTGDLSLAWRPTPWLGTSFSAWNVGRWDEEIARARLVPSVVLRPLEDRLFIGADYNLPWLDTEQGLVTGNVRVQAPSGWVGRVSVDQNLRVGMGVEIYWGPAGIGGFVDMPTGGGSDVLATVYGRTPPGARHKLSLGSRVASFKLDQSYPYRESTSFFGRAGETYLHLLSRLSEAAADPHIEGVLIEVEQASFSFAQIEELRGRISAMRESGKKVLVYLDQYPDNRAYLLASSADEVYMHPAGDLELVGISAEMQYFRGTLDLLGVEPQVARRSEYKSAPEGMMRTESSGPAREQMNALLDDLSHNFQSAIASDHGWDIDQVARLIDEGPYTADEALDKRLVDSLVYPDELGELLERVFSERLSIEDDYGNQFNAEGWLPRREIAVVTIDGGIVSGQSSGPGFFGGGYTAGADTIVAQLEAAAAEDTIKAVVIRVDSPGGSSFASDEIWRAVERVKMQGKPVVVSMGSVAASGGYYVAAGADAIYANPSTITGSIGVYAGPKMNLAGLYDKVGVGSEIYTRGRNSAMWSMSKPMDDHEFAALDRMVAHTYAQFKQRVSDGRSLDDEQVEAVARGRVWSGVDAQQGSLVDELGGFHDAVIQAREAAGIAPDADISLIRLSSRGGLDGDVVGYPLGGMQQRAPIVARITARLPTMGPEVPQLPQVPALADIERWHAMSDERVLALMPYVFQIQ